jgi:hypothetical protein
MPTSRLTATVDSNHYSQKAFYAGEGDFHDPEYDHTKFVVPFANNRNPDTQRIPGHCTYSINLYATEGFEHKYRTSLPVVAACVVASLFGFMILPLFLAYDVFVRRNLENLVVVAIRSTAIVSSMFPSTVRDRVLANDENSMIADLFPDATILFADIAGFTSWSSNHEPVQGMFPGS